MSNVVVDSSVLIDFVRCRDKSKAMLPLLVLQNELHISVLTHTELWSGKSVWESARAQRELESLFSGLTIVPLTEQISRLAGKLKSQHKEIALVDCIIAATALDQNMEFATLNHKHFTVFKKLKLTPVPPQTAQSD